jgi:hypothetical protein
MNSSPFWNKWVNQPKYHCRLRSSARLENAPRVSPAPEKPHMRIQCPASSLALAIATTRLIRRMQTASLDWQCRYWKMALRCSSTRNRGDEEEKVPWETWMEDKILEADHVLTVCTELYRKKIRQEVAEDVGQGVCWGGRSHLLPALPSGAERDKVPPHTILACGAPCQAVG